MKNLRKILPVALMAMTLCSCGGGVDVTNKHLPTDDPSKEVVIQFWHCMGHDKSENLGKIVKKFNEQYAGKYRVEATAPEKNYDKLHETVMTRISTGEVPALCMGYPDSFSMYITKNLETSHIYKLDNFFNDENYGYSAEEKADFVDAFLEEGNHYQFDGIWSVPMYKSTEIMYYNANYFCGDNPETEQKVAKDTSLDAAKKTAYMNALADVQNATAYATDEQLAALKSAVNEVGGYTYEVPATWAQLETVSRAVIANRAAQGIVNPNFYPFGYDSDANLLISQMAQLGIPYTVNNEESRNNTDKHFAFNNQQAKDLVQSIIDLHREKIMTTKGLLGGKYTNEAFTSLESIMSIGSTGGSSYNVSGNFKVKLAPVPYKGNTPKYIQQGPSICFFDNDDDYIHKGAWLFYKMMAETENNAALALENSYDPVRKSSYETTNYANWIAKHDLDLKYDIPYNTAQIKQYYMTSEVFIGSSEARNQLDDIIKNVVNGGMTIDQAFSTAYNRACDAAK